MTRFHDHHHGIIGEFTELYVATKNRPTEAIIHDQSEAAVSFLDNNQGSQITKVVKHVFETVLTLPDVPRAIHIEDGIFQFLWDPGQLDVLQHWLNRSDIELIIAPYDQRQWLHGSLFSDFVSMIGVSSRGIDMADIRINESLSFASSEILRLSLLGGLPEDIFDIMLEHVRRTDRKDVDYPLTAETIAVCRERMTETIELYRPFLRSGFDESYLFEKRPR